MSSGKGHAESPTPQQRLEHLNAVLRAIRGVNQLIVHEKDPDALVRQACSLLVGTRGYYSAWIALLDAEGNLRTAAESGLGDAFQTMAERLQRGEFASCGRSALAERGVHVIDAPARECVDCPLSHSCDGKSGMTIRLEHGGETHGLMSVSVPAKYARDDEEVELFQEVAGDIAYAVHNLAAEDAHNRAVEALLGSEERYRALFEQSREAISLVAPDGRMLDVNQAWLDLYGYSRDELPEFNASDGYANPEDRKEFLRRVAEAGFAEDEVRFRKKDGTVMDCHMVLVARKDNRGNILAYQGIVRDITERRRMELEVRRQREHFKALFANSPEGIASVDVRGRVVDVNPAFESLFGYRREDVLGRKPDDLVVPKGLEKEARQATRSALTGAVCIPETMRRRADGSLVPVSVLGAGVSIDGKKTGAFAIYRDMSEYRKAHDRLQDSFIDLVETMTRSMESLDPYTSGHQRRVARLADLVGRELGMDDDRLQGLYIGALLHDIGKLSVPSTILTKPGRLTGHEWNIIRAHSRRGYDILKETNLPWPVAGMALSHHERLDGSGYPDGVKGPELSLEVRILGVCDVVEAMSSDRPFRPARPAQEVMQELRTGSGQKFDPKVVEATLEVIESGAFPLGAGGADAGGDGPGEEKRPSYVGPVAGEGATVVQRTAETVGSVSGSDPSGGTHLEEQPGGEFLNLAETLSRAMASRDPSTTNHQRRVADFVVQVGSCLGLPAERLWGLRLGGLLHDVGKIAVPELILTRPGKLSREELELVRTHPQAGYEILRDAGLPPVVPLLALHHHERLDGSGYPQGLSGDALTMEDRILSVCNVVEAMGAHRPYRRGLGKKEVIAEIVAGRGTRYEPAVVDCILDLLESGEFVLGK